MKRYMSLMFLSVFILLFATALLPGDYFSPQVSANHAQCADGSQIPHSGSPTLIDNYCNSRGGGATASSGGCSNDVRFLGLPAWYKYLPLIEEDGNCNIALEKNADGDTDWQKAAIAILFALIDIATVIAGLVAVIFVIVGGFTFITSSGQPEKAKNARNTILNALIGVVIAIVAGIIVNIVGKTFIA